MAHELGEASLQNSLEGNISDSYYLTGSCGPTGRSLSGSGKAAGARGPAPAGSKRGEHSLNCIRVTVGTREILVSVFHPTQHLEGFPAAAALVLIERHRSTSSLILLAGARAREEPDQEPDGTKR